MFQAMAMYSVKYAGLKSGMVIRPGQSHANFQSHISCGMAGANICQII
jgi:hypothetical protein